MFLKKLWKRMKISGYMYKFQDTTPISGHFRTNFKISGQWPGLGLTIHTSQCLTLKYIIRTTECQLYADRLAHTATQSTHTLLYTTASRKHLQIRNDQTGHKTNDQHIYNETQKTTIPVLLTTSFWLRKALTGRISGAHSSEINENINVSQIT